MGGQPGQAGRRLAAALKSLAVLRRLGRPALVAQVNVAAGPMLVNNMPAELDGGS